MRRSQATRKPVTLTDHAVAVVSSLHETLGSTWSVVLGVLMVLAVFGGLHHVFGANEDRAEMISSIPDGISEECHAKLLHAYYGKSSVDRYDDSGSAAVARPTSDCGEIGTVR